MIRSENEQGKSVARAQTCDSCAPPLGFVRQSDVEGRRSLVGRYGRVALQDLVDRVELVARDGADQLTRDASLMVSM